jgi:hypothetical protein
MSSLSRVQQDATPCNNKKNATASGDRYCRGSTELEQHPRGASPQSVAFAIRHRLGRQVIVSTHPLPIGHDRSVIGKIHVAISGERASERATSRLG